ncbi:flagellar biosynthetic protein FliO [Roseateles koreensis]|uniref:Flagellar protein n=1 Tax=Roseateles koreensis TaxID=2987526 RepID=A0ABT5KTU4_9BURK|nr:flagellar biosynthetic protein FliO [Roseateles koreensis]MDC8786358.1 flagellar biosynthetic protein FliO [Roseateles koreensis]
MNSSLLPFVWFLAILCLIPLALWLLKRTPMGGSLNPQGQMRVVAQLPLSPNQKLLTVEVGQGEHRRWLVLGVTAQQISTLHELPPQAEAPGRGGINSTGGPGDSGNSFAQMLGKRLRGGSNDGAQDAS